MTHTHQAGKLHPGVAALIVIVLIGVATTVVVALQNNQEPSQSSTTTSQQQSTINESSQPSTDATETTSYRNGTYEATGSYVSPGGRESIDLTVTIENGVITATNLEQNATSREGREYQAAFASGYAELVVGKNVDEVSLSRVAGSSLTSNGFNAALDQIKDDAAV